MALYCDNMVQDRLKMVQKCWGQPSKCAKSATPCSDLGSNRPFRTFPGSKKRKNLWENCIFDTMLMHCFPCCVCVSFGFKAAPKCCRDGPKMIQNGPNTAQAGLKKPQAGPKMGPRWPQAGPRWLQNGSNIAQEATRLLMRPQEGPGKAPKWPQEAPR